MFNTRFLKCILFIPLTGAVVLGASWAGVSMRLAAERTEVLASSREKTAVLVNALVQHAGTAIHDADVIALLVKREFELNEKVVNLAALQSDGFFSRANAAQVSIVDANGQILQSTMPYAGGKFITDRRHFTVHRKPDVQGLYVSPPVLGRVSGEWTIQMTRRLESPDGRFAGIVVVSEERKYLLQRYANVASLGPNGLASIFLNDGTALSGIPTPSSTPDDRCRATYEDEVSISACRRIPGYPLYAKVTLSKLDELAQYTQMKRVYIVNAAILSAFFALFVTTIALLVYRLSNSRQRLKVLSETDALTGLLNRHGVLANLEHQLETAVRPLHVVVMYLDLCGMKRVNDALGHEAGDQVLKKIALRLNQVLPSVVIGRFGGDEFIVMFSASSAADIDARIRETLAKIASVFDMPVTLRGNVLAVSASIGVSVREADFASASLLIREADESMYSAKQEALFTGKTTWRFYTDAMRRSSQQALESDQDLRLAIKENKLQLGFTPIREFGSKSVVGYRIVVAVESGLERLAPVLALHTVNQQNGLLGPTTEFALYESCNTLGRWQEQGIQCPLLVYGLTHEQFLSIDCASMLHRAGQQYPKVLHRLVLEIPEAALDEHSALAIERLEALSQTGVQLIIAGFSGRFSSYTWLENAPFSGVVIEPRVWPADIFRITIDELGRWNKFILLESAVPIADIVSLWSAYVDSEAFMRATQATELSTSEARIGSDEPRP
ncbi:diguanylate cyclase domain-containing protein [Burkholderia ubonensis]|uniref:sensor domain-containing diguanylate cyclase n=1 Tax=Burkholderia ubonensis TaxID=101571 RepID=UPI00016A4D28|nr:diguanylate cyclase [Burkholderia ubonensis]